jgi:hypothetical protein
MKPFLHKTIGVLTMVSVIFSACSKQDAGTKPDANSQDGAKINYEITAVNPNSSGTIDAGGSERLATIVNDPAMAKTTINFDFKWTEVLVRLRELEFEAEKGDSYVFFKTKTDVTVDVLKAIGVIGMISIPKGTYQHVAVKVKVAGDKKKPAAKLGGVITWKGKQFPFVVNLIGKINLKASAKDVVVGDGTVDLKGKLKIDLNVIVSKLQIGAFSGSFENGQLVLNVNTDASADDQRKVDAAVDGSMSVEHVRNN